MKYLPIELHTHTEHSDGDFTPQELIENLKQGRYYGFSLTDHNTQSAINLIQEFNFNESMPMLSGIEWTTYFGHMLVWGCQKFVDWRKAEVDTIDIYTQEIKKNDGVIGIAHPATIGSPFCTGCRWDFEIKKFENIDYIEIWNSVTPEVKNESKLAYELWRQLLAEGYKIGVTSGRDWHRVDVENRNVGYTFLGFDGKVTGKSIKQALKKGRTYISLGLKLDFKFIQEAKQFTLGEEISCKNNIQIEVKLEESDFPEIANEHFENKKLRIYNNDEIIFNNPINSELVFTLEKTVKGTIHFEVIADFKEGKQISVLVTSPIYIVE